MNIILYGNFVVDYCSEVHHAKSLEALGHNVTRLQETTVTTDDVLFKSLKADMLVWIHSHGFINKGSYDMGQVLSILRASNIPTVAYHLDLYMGLERWKDYLNSPYMKVEHFFTVDKLMADWFNENTDTKGHFLPAGCFADETYIHKDYDKNNFENDIIFVGSKGYHHEWQYRPQLIDWLKQTYGSRFKHVGGDGETGTIRGHDLNRVYAKSKIAVGDSLNIGFNYPYYSSDRLFESICRYGFTIYPRIHGLDAYFKDEKEVVYYTHGDFDDLKTKIDYYLEHDEERESIRHTGHIRGKNEHTYYHRWQTIIQEVFGND